MPVQGSDKHMYSHITWFHFEMASWLYFKLSCGQKVIKNVLERCEFGETVGDVVARLTANLDLVYVTENFVQGYRTCMPSAVPTPEAVQFPLDTPISVLDNFGIKFVSVSLSAETDKSQTNEKSSDPNALDLLVSINRQYNRLPNPR